MECSRCGAPQDGSTVLCSFCGNPLQQITDLQSEVRALDELNKIAAAIGQSVGTSKGGVLAIYSAAGDDFVRAQKLAAFWTSAFVPKHPDAQIKAFQECLQRVGGGPDALNSAMLSRADVILDAFKLNAVSKPGLQGSIPILEKTLSKAKHRSRLIWYVFAALGAALTLFFVIMISGLSGSSAKEKSGQVVPATTGEQTENVPPPAQNESCKEAMQIAATGDVQRSLEPYQACSGPQKEQARRSIAAALPGAVRSAAMHGECKKAKDIADLYSQVNALRVDVEKQYPQCKGKL